MSSPYNIFVWYWSVQDSSPGTQVFSSASGSFVPLANGTYVAWLAADGGNSPTVIDTLANLYSVFDTYNQTAARPAYQAISSGSNVTLTNPLPTFLVVTPSVDNIKVFMPQSNKPGSLAKGQSIRIRNGAAAGTKPLFVYAFDTTTLLWAQVVKGGEDITLTQTDNTSTNGSLVAASYMPMTGGTLFGGLMLAPASGSVNLQLNKAASGANTSLLTYTNSLLRWAIFAGNAAAESGSNLGSNFAITRYDDSGASISTPFTIDRASGAVKLEGSKTNDSAAAGFVGEFIEASIPNSSKVTLTTTTWAQIATITLTPGDWDVWGVLQYDGGGTTTITAFQGCIFTTTAAPDFTQGRYAANYLNGAVALSVLPTLLVPMSRFSVSVNTNIFLNTQAIFGTAGCQAYGRLMARRRC